MGEKRKRRQINLATDDEFEEALVEIQRMEQAARVPSMSQVIREAVVEKRDRLREQARRRK